MKRNNLFKAVGITILVLVLLSWIVPIVYSVAGIDGEVSNQIGVVALLNAILETFSGFGSVILYILVVGGFYGVLKAIGVYDSLVDRYVTKATNKEKAFLVCTIVVLAVISSIAGLDLGLLILFPLLIDVIVRLGYDKLVALSATVGATLIGMYGATLAGTLYGANNTILELGKFDQIIPKLVFFVLGLVLLLVFVLSYTNKKGLKKVEDKEVLSETKVKEVKKVDKKNDKRHDKKHGKNEERRGHVRSESTDYSKGYVSTVAARIVLCITVLVMLLGTINWGGIFKTNFFENAHNAWTGVKIAKFPILEKLLGGVDAFGSWLTPTRFQTYALLIVLAIFALKLLYKAEGSKVFEGFVKGVKEYIVPALAVLLACSVFVLVYYNPFLSEVTGHLLNSKGFNVAGAGIYTIINSIFYVDYYYLAYSVLYGINSVYTDKTVLSIISVMFTNLYSLVMLISPTSVLLLASLAISDVKYTDWVKYIWKFVLVLFIVSFVVLTVMMLV